MAGLAKFGRSLASFTNHHFELEGKSTLWRSSGSTQHVCVQFFIWMQDLVPQGGAKMSTGHWQHTGGAKNQQPTAHESMRWKAWRFCRDQEEISRHVMGRPEEIQTRLVLLAAPASSRKKNPGGHLKSWHNVVRKDVKPHGGFWKRSHKWDKAWWQKPMEAFGPVASWYRVGLNSLCLVLSK